MGFRFGHILNPSSKWAQESFCSDLKYGIVLIPLVGGRPRGDPHPALWGGQEILVRCDFQLSICEIIFFIIVMPSTAATFEGGCSRASHVTNR